eukprot:9937210-Prorocentrum_lima.AAC.1
MTSSLVGSEMCIRDREWRVAVDTWKQFKESGAAAAKAPHSHISNRQTKAVSYTHLTLPTICSV